MEDVEIKTIKFTSRASIKIKDNFYTIEYGEERQINNFSKINIDIERQKLIDDCNSIVDNQIMELQQLLQKN